MVVRSDDHPSIDSKMAVIQPQRGVAKNIIPVERIITSSLHASLVKRAERWLRNTLHCRVVLCELVAYTHSGETPDAIGWVNGRCILVEAKTSRADFFSDRKKMSRLPRMKALGHWRFYLTPPGLIRQQDIPEGWGVYEIHGKTVRHVGGVAYRNAIAAPFQSCRDSEVALLVSALARRGET